MSREKRIGEERCLLEIVAARVADIRDLPLIQAFRLELLHTLGPQSLDQLPKIMNYLLVNI